jgi:hypothetical protein
MNGFQEVRLFVTDTDAEPAVGSAFTDILPQLLADNGPGTGTDITPGQAYSYLHRSAVVSGLEPGTYYLWVEAIDKVNKSSGVQRVGSHTIEVPTVYEFKVREMPGLGWVEMTEVEASTFQVTAGNIELIDNKLGASDPVDCLVDGTVSDSGGKIRWNDNTLPQTDYTGQNIFKVTDPAGGTGAVSFTLSFNRWGYTPTLDVTRTTPDGVQAVVQDTSRASTATEPSPVSLVISFGDQTVWEFFVSEMPPGGGGVWLFWVDSSFGDTVVIPESTWKLYFHQGNRNRDATAQYFSVDGSLVSTLDYVYSTSLGEGDLLWTMFDPSRNSSASFTVNWARPQNVPGLTVKRNGVVVLSEASRGSADYEPHQYPVTYTIP